MNMNLGLQDRYSVGSFVQGGALHEADNDIGLSLQKFKAHLSIKGFCQT